MKGNTTIGPLLDQSKQTLEWNLSSTEEKLGYGACTRAWWSSWRRRRRNPEMASSGDSSRESHSDRIQIRRRLRRSHQRSILFGGFKPESNPNALDATRKMRLSERTWRWTVEGEEKGRDGMIEDWRKSKRVEFSKSEGEAQKTKKKKWKRVGVGEGEDLVLFFKKLLKVELIFYFSFSQSYNFKKYITFILLYNFIFFFFYFLY